MTTIQTIKEAEEKLNIRTHSFIVSTPDYEFYRVIYCTKCGKVAWNFNKSDETNKVLQENIGNCINTEVINYLKQK